MMVTDWPYVNSQALSSCFPTHLVLLRRGSEKEAVGTWQPVKNKPPQSFPFPLPKHGIHAECSRAPCGIMSSVKHLSCSDLLQEGFGLLLKNSNISTLFWDKDQFLRIRWTSKTQIQQGGNIYLHPNNSNMINKNLS